MYELFVFKSENKFFKNWGMHDQSLHYHKVIKVRSLHFLRGIIRHI